MLYSDQLLQNKGPLARVWLASNLERKLSKNEFLRTNIVSSVDAIVHNEAGPLALRVSGQLLLGVVKIYGKKTKYLLDDCNEAVLKLRMTFRPGMVDLPSGTTVASSSALTLQNAITDLDLAALPEPVLDLDFGNLRDFDLNLGQFDLTGLPSGLNADINLTTFDASVEMGRGITHEEDYELARMGDHDDFNLGLGFEGDVTRAENLSSPINMERHIAGMSPLPELDINMDMDMDMGLHEGEISIEMGREAPPGRTLADEFGGNGALQLPGAAMLEKVSPEGEEERLPGLIPSDEEIPETPGAIDLHDVSLHEGIAGLYGEDMEEGPTARTTRHLIKRARYDATTELRSSAVMAMQRDRSSILKQHAQLPYDPFVKNYLEFSATPAKFLTSVVFNENKLNPMLASALNPGRVLEALKRKRELLKETEIPEVEPISAQAIEGRLGIVEALSPEISTENLEGALSSARAIVEETHLEEHILHEMPSFDEENIILESDTELQAIEARPITPVGIGFANVDLDVSQESVVGSTQESEAEESEQIVSEEEPSFPKRNINDVSKSTIETVQFLRTKFDSLGVNKENIGAVSVVLDTVIKERSNTSAGNRKVAVRTFFEMLILATKDSISLSQEETFGEIHVSGKNGLYSDTWDTVNAL
ncbi:hypothetical protein NADFUDRAFT_53021 [Nadsonia fulvescens var. elongata DSM 6958]|uniref:Rad21/Rec8-like protein N-terminal domain-containing protein n=1 Tax=Nadsonia fulvescens var. elongata DSM 6958 TaxID=857566 RepID=A0A1E3PFF3_9ASCO|nr:hypothetical protein NADFUDRAFT_53021 [Nadsonia fulvescens var. elongata DSM 6958]